MFFFFRPKEIGYAHMRIVEGVNSLLQLSGLLARMCNKVTSQDSWVAWLVAINRWIQETDSKVNSGNNDREMRTLRNEQDVLDFLLSAIVMFMNLPYVWFIVFWFLSVSRSFYDNCINSCTFIGQFSLSISRQTHEIITYAMRQRARVDNFTLCCRKRQINVSFSCVGPVIYNQFHHNIVKVVCVFTASLTMLCRNSWSRRMKNLLQFVKSSTVDRQPRETTNIYTS